MENSANGTGGALYVIAGSNDVTVSRGQFIDNNSSAAGGAIRNDAAQPIIISSVRFDENSAAAEPTISGLRTIT